jgi:hypothetical protein
MKRHNGWGRLSLQLAALALPLAACGTTHVTRIEEPIGPAPHSASFLDEGRLVVHTQMRTDVRIADEGYASAPQARREPYRIYDLDGRMVRYVTGDTADMPPEAVTLHSGDYVVRAKGLDGQLVEFEARIVPGRTTEVVLDRSWAPPLEPHARRAFVRAPDGTIVGWRATAIGGGPRR